MSTRFAVLGVACLSFALTGCGLDQHPPYSEKVKYGVRTDPVFTGTGKELGEERYDVDTPGMLPLLSIKDIDKPHHPYAAKKADALKALRDPATLSSKDHQAMESMLETLFGTPARPTVNAKEGQIDSKIIDDLKIGDDKLAEGSRLYRVHCLHCHGVSGDGRGPTARWINPHPRDFRRGIFKFQSVDQSHGTIDIHPRRDDLVRTVRQGIEGTAMPAFHLLQDKEIDLIVGYVIHLSVRGYVEYVLLKEEFDLEANGSVAWKKQDKILDSGKFYQKKTIEEWHVSQDPAKAIHPAKYTLEPKDLAASMARGQQIFNAKPTEEFKRAHALKVAKKNKLAVNLGTALENKREAAKKAKPKITDDELAEIKLNDKEVAAASVLSDADLKELDQTAGTEAALKAAETTLKGANCVSCHNNYGRQALYRFDGWGTLVKPNNFTLGVFRGGRRPVDVYYRIHSGINGSGMTPFGGNPFRGHEEYIWDLVNFVSNVPYPAMRKQLPVSID